MTAVVSLTDIKATVIPVILMDFLGMIFHAVCTMPDGTLVVCLAIQTMRKPNRAGLITSVDVAKEENSFIFMLEAVHVVDSLDSYGLCLNPRTEVD